MAPADTRLTILLLGNVTILLDGQPVAALRSRTARALFIYLVCHKRPFSRQFLANLFWQGSSAKQGAANLRSLLSTLRPALGEYLVITRRTVAFNHEADYHLDLAEFEAHITELNRLLQTAVSATPETIDRLQAVLDLYRGDFLEGFYAGRSPDFEEWALLLRERLRRLAVGGWQRLVTYYLENGVYQTGLYYGERLLAVDPYDENVQRQMMWLYARSGHRHAALKQYQACRRLLADELSVAPAPETTALYERLRAIDFPPPHNLPPSPTAFVGREKELVAIVHRLSRPNCRLLSVLGPGGIGKTRLVLEVARRIVAQRSGQFLDGVYFVSLVNLQSAAFLTITLADALGLVFQGAQSSQKQLLDYLRGRELLLVLDNFEHLIDRHSLNWLAAIVNHAPAVKLLLTSRERLKLVEEQVFDLPGLDYPSTFVAETAASYGAVQLFLQQATRVQPAFTATAAELEAIVALCHLMDGMPLGIELAAAGVRHFSCRHIASRLQQRLDLDFGQLHNRPGRHQSLRAAFQHSWSLLTAQEQAVACRFSVFQGPFDAAAAKAVTEATLSQLTLLHDKSLLQREGDRFDLHPLMRHFLAEKLAQDEAERLCTGNRHATYYFELGVTSSRANMERDFHYLQEILRANNDNLIAAALWIAEQHDFSNRRLVTLMERLIFYFNHSYRYETAKVVFQQLIEALHANADGCYEERWLTAVLVSRIAHADLSLNAYERARQRLVSVLPEAYSLENGALISACLHWLGIIAWRAGEFAVGIQRLQASIEAVVAYAHQYRWPVLRTLGDLALAAGQIDKAMEAHEKAYAMALEYDSYDEAASIYELAMGSIRHRCGRLHTAQDHLQKALALSRAKREPVELVLVLRQLAHVLVDCGDNETAVHLLAEARQIAATLKDSRLTALAAQTQGWQAEWTQEFTVARTFYEESLALFQEIEDKDNLAWARVHLGRACVALGQWETAVSHLQPALATFRQWNHRGGTAVALTAWGLFYRQQGAWDKAQRRLQEALYTAIEGKERYFALQTAVELAALWVEMGDPLAARPLLTFARMHEATTAHNAARTQRLLNTLAKG